MHLIKLHNYYVLVLVRYRNETSDFFNQLVLIIGKPRMSIETNSCTLKPNENTQLDMWWQGKKSGSPKHEGRVQFEFVGSSDSNNLLFKGRFSSGGSAYNIERATISGDAFYFKTTAFDRPGRSGRETYIEGRGKCGNLGLLGTFRYVDKGADTYIFDFGMTPIPSAPERP